MKKNSSYFLAFLLQNARKYFFKQRSLFLAVSIFYTLTLFSQKIENYNIGDKLNLKKVISFHVPSLTEGNNLKLKVKNGFMYLLLQDFIFDDGLLLIREKIETNSRDTFTIKVNIPISEISDFEVNDNYLYFLLNKQLLKFDLLTNKTETFLISFPNNSVYRHFYNINLDTFFFYKWQIGERKIEENSIYKYIHTKENWELIDSNVIDGLNFLAINKGNKYFDLNNCISAKVKPNKYEIIINNFKNGIKDTLSRLLDSSKFISESYIKKLHADYTRSPNKIIFDSLDKHCFEKSQIRSIRVSGDSLIYVTYENYCSKCYWFGDKNTTRYLDIWKLNSLTNEWALLFYNLRLDNHSVCEKSDKSILHKNLLFFSFTGIESEWTVFSNYLFIPKIISDKVDLEGDLSYIYNPKSRNDSQNIQIFIFSVD